MNETSFLAINASGRPINILNDDKEPMLNNKTSTTESKRRYHCTESGCTKSFTTSGHLARHHRIHTGEKNFPCFYPGCLSRFSRQDNMMQHYRTHMSNNPRRVSKKSVDEVHPKPKLYAHQRIRSDPYKAERPLTIDQHLDKYYQQSTQHEQPQKYRYVPINIKKPAKRQQPQQPQEEESPVLFYQHKPLSYKRQINTPLHTLFPSTLLHPKLTSNSPSLSSPSSTNDTTSLDSSSFTSHTTDESSVQTGLLQLAHIVSTFG
ncbi:Transcriptional regulator NRG1 [Choanephora cucurbitarum]|uniref:Transcriptional regulator NRG1 n=2 Tax=Choanephora cucurbitarum TaxID=101091 RepID=A0A1C7NLF9_9FUNG|nr:Transcriptional regulator NRG1 [Choanephora cucurbitarum]